MKRTLLTTIALLALCAFAAKIMHATGGYDGRYSTAAGWSDQTSRTVAASSTQYTYLLSNNAGSFNATESNRQNYVAGPFMLFNLAVRTSSPQPSDGALTCTVRDNSADTGVTVTIPANGAAGIYEATYSGGIVPTFAKGDLIDLKCVNASASASAGIFEVRFMDN